MKPSEKKKPQRGGKLQFNVRLPARLYLEIREELTRHGVTKDEAARRLLDHFLRLKKAERDRICSRSLAAIFFLSTFLHSATGASVEAVGQRGSAPGQPDKPEMVPAGWSSSFDGGSAARGSATNGPRSNYSSSGSSRALHAINNSPVSVLTEPASTANPRLADEARESTLTPESGKPRNSSGTLAAGDSISTGLHVRPAMTSMIVRAAEHVRRHQDTRPMTRQATARAAVSRATVSGRQLVSPPYSFTGVSVSSTGFPSPTSLALTPGPVASEQQPAISICHPKASALRIVALSGRDSGSACLQDASAAVTNNAGRAVFAARPATPSLVTETLLDAVERVESGGNPMARGGRGESGSFQFRAAAWSDVNRERARVGLPAVGYSIGTTNRAVARVFARSYLLWLESYLSATNRKQPTTDQLYAAWNLGPQGFRRRGFSLSRCPASTRRAAQQILRITGGK